MKTKQSRAAAQIPHALCANPACSRPAGGHTLALRHRMKDGSPLLAYFCSPKCRETIRPFMEHRGMLEPSHEGAHENAPE
jgi:hypothetical protein